MLRTRNVAVVAAGLIGIGASARAAVVFDFEEQAQTGFNAGALTTLDMAKDGLAITITRPGSPNRFDVYDVNDIGNPTFPAAWGVRSISPWFSNAGTAFVATFSQPVQQIAIDMGDFGGDPDTLLLEAFSTVDASGAILTSATTQLPLGGSSFTQATLSVDAGAPLIRSIRFMGGTESFQTPFGIISVPNSVYYDNLTVTVPEPASLALLALFAVALRSHR